MKSGIGYNYIDQNPLIGSASRSMRSKFGKPSPRSLHGSNNSLASSHKRVRKPVESQKREKVVNKKPSLNHTEYAYREAVNRLKSMLTDSYGCAKQNIRRPGYESDDTDNISVIERPALSEISKYIPSSGLSRYSHPHSSYSTQPTRLKSAESIASLQPVSQYVSPAAPTAISVAKPNNELLQFIEKQEGYIEQLERESHFCRGELNNVLTKVKDVISENEALTEQTKLGTIASDTSDSGSNDYNYRTTSKEKHEKIKLSGPNIVFESRISELEAQLAQAEIDIKKLTQENNQYKQRLANGEGITSNAITSDVQNRQIKTLQREKKSLEDNVRKLQCIVDSLKANDAQNFSNSLRSRDLVEQSAFEKAQSDIEIRRLREELERQHGRVREMQLEMTKKIAEERSLAERRYSYHVQQVDGDLSSQWETASRLQLELERQKRAEADYRRDLAQKNSQIEDLRSEMKQKTTSLLSDIAQVNAEKQSLEQEITSLRMQLERAERQTKVESSRLNAEIMSLRQRLDRADADLLQSKRENLRLSDEVAALEKEITLGDLNRETRPSKELTKLMSDMESKHLATVSELEGMVQGQRQLMEKLTAECKTLTNKLEDATLKHKAQNGSGNTKKRVHFAEEKCEANAYTIVGQRPTKQTIGRYSNNRYSTITNDELSTTFGFNVPKVKRRAIYVK
ncbi:serologically defined colon cancer antigen 8 homolog isoform X3 [Contarinia nasturtii]|uniref:serologically defined colon cancer antigen 8 homolog isoform X3 n=1 Tax=Contarinia nasturtii TaxID=265458 RepID=UPI0012D3BD3E|nr:serologically defined colon cancer antigen 8 homolog isoform X3 [Contarinia nasturtii]